MLPRRTAAAMNGLLMMINHLKTVCPMGIMVEVGSWVGVSTALFAKNVKIVVAVDAWEPGLGDLGKLDMAAAESEFDLSVALFKNVTKIKARSLDAAALYTDESFDFVYIDASHDYQSAKDDIAAWLPKVRRGGYLCGHDYHTRKFPGVVQAVNERWTPDKIFPDTSWIKKVV